jgi:hypothetical protein
MFYRNFEPPGVSTECLLPEHKLTLDDVDSYTGQFPQKRAGVWRLPRYEVTNPFSGKVEIVGSKYNLRRRGTLISISTILNTIHKGVFFIRSCRSELKDHEANKSVIDRIHYESSYSPMAPHMAAINYRHTLYDDSQPPTEVVSAAGSPIISPNTLEPGTIPQLHLPTPPPSKTQRKRKLTQLNFDASWRNSNREK